MGPMGFLLVMIKGEIHRKQNVVAATISTIVAVNKNGILKARAMLGSC